jgi:serine protease inhibitor
MTQQAMPHLVRSDVERATPVETPAVLEAAAGMRAFGYRLLSEHPELLTGGNGVVSPASIATAFAMARAGAVGQTADQIDRVFSLPGSNVGPAFNFLTDQWRTGQGGPNAPELSVANSLFAQSDFPIERPFLDALARDFGAGVNTVDFESGQAAPVINAWVREHTRDRIKALFDDLPSFTRLVLANAIYLKATWASRFAAGSTRTAEFHRTSNGPVDVPFMRQTKSFDHAEGDGWSAVRLPYKGGDLSMWVLLPDGTGDPVRLLDPDVLAKATTTATRRSVGLSLPKWDFRSDAPLTDILPAMGLTRAFTDAAEFPGISRHPLKVHQVMHRADVTVDEEGTEAAAVTGVSMVRVSLTIPQVTFDADHPFAFVVLHDATRAPLFQGVVGDPSATR